MTLGLSTASLAATALLVLSTCRSAQSTQPFAIEDTARFAGPIALAAAGETIDVVRHRGYAGPTLFDADRDGKLDLFVGSFAGKIAHHRNVGGAREPEFAAGELLEADGAVLAISNW